eukprot:g3757.t1
MLVFRSSCRQRVLHNRYNLRTIHNFSSLGGAKFLNFAVGKKGDESNLILESGDAELDGPPLAPLYGVVAQAAPCSSPSSSIDSRRKRKHFSRTSSISMCSTRSISGTSISSSQVGGSDDDDQRSYQDREKEIGTLMRDFRELWANSDIKEASSIGEEIREKVSVHFGKKHPVYATALNNLGLINKFTGDYDKAIEFFEDAARTYREVLGPEQSSIHHALGTVLHNLGLCYQSKGVSLGGLKRMENFETGQVAMEDAVSIRTKTLGEIHPETCLSRACLSSFLRESGKKEEAETMLLDVLEKVDTYYEAKGLNADSKPIKATILNNLGYLYKVTERAKKAIPLYKKSLEIREAQHGREHPDTIVTRMNLAEAYYAIGNQDEGKRIQQELLDEMTKKGYKIPDEI